MDSARIPILSQEISKMIFALDPVLDSREALPSLNKTVSGVNLRHQKVKVEPDGQRDTSFGQQAMDNLLYRWHTQVIHLKNGSTSPSVHLGKSCTTCYQSCRLLL